MLLLAQGILALQAALVLLVVVNVAGLVLLLVRDKSAHGALTPFKRMARHYLVYQFLILGAFIMLVPFYWMVITAFKDAETSAAFPPVWTPSRVITKVENPATGELQRIVRLTTPRKEGDTVQVVPYEDYQFRRVEEGSVSITRETPDRERVFTVDPGQFQSTLGIDLDLKNFLRAWYRPEETSRGQVNFLTYFLVSLITSSMATAGALITSAFAAFAFARLEFWGKTVLFYVILATMMVPGQVLLIPNFLILSALGMLDTYAALVVPWFASVFTIFLMRQFFMTVPEDLWDAARIDGSSRFRYLWQVVVPLSKPVFITAGIFDFLNNWNSLLWPLIVTSTPSKRTLMVGLQNLSDEAGAEFHVLMAASCLAVLPILIAFFFLQRFFIEGIARTGLK